MRNTRKLFAVLSLVLMAFLMSCQAGYKEGDQVCAMWKNKSWYLGTVAGVKGGGKYFIKYADGDEGEVTAKQIKPIPEKPNLKAGDRVFAVWATARFYNGVVEEVKEDGAIVKWDDGSKPSLVKWGRIMKLKK